MGFAISWLAIDNSRSSDLLSKLALDATASREWVPESPVCAVTTASGWYVVFFNDASPMALKPEVLRSLSELGPVVTCQVEEHSMVSTASLWRDGKELWYVMHDAEDGPMNLDVVGQVPQSFEAVRDAQMAKQKAGTADYVFDVPVILAQQATGFRHDDVIESESEPFIVLRPRG